MKRSLHLFSLAVSISLLSCSPYLSGQSVVFSEDFSGFTTGTHSSPSTYDQSGSLDSKTTEPGWTGFKVYSAGGEIKLGTANVPGWIKTPAIDIFGIGGTAILRFDISRWPDDAAIVQVYLNDSPLGDPLEPTNEFETVELPLANVVSTASIKFESLAKRFYLDNVQIATQNLTYITNHDQQKMQVIIYPNPASDIINIENLNGYTSIEIVDINGRVVKSYHLNDKNILQISLSAFPSGIYIIRIISPQKIFSSRLIKYDQMRR